MRIALVVSGGFDRSARERVVPSLLWLVERLARRHDVHVFVLHYYPEPCSYPLLGATVHDIGRPFGAPGLRRGLQGRRLERAMAGCGPFDVLHAYQGMPAIVSLRVASRLGIPVVATLDSGELVALADIRYGLQRRWLDRRGIDAVIQKSGRVTVATRFMASLIPDGACLAPVAVVQLGINVDDFPRAARADGPPWRLLRVASLNEVKDFSTLLDAFALLVSGGLDIRLDVVGEDTMNGRVQAVTQSLGLESRVTFHGFQPTDQLAAFYARAHLHIVSSRHEAAGVVVLEAAATGLPTVGTAVGYVADWSPDRAIAVPVQDAPALAAAIADLIRDPEKRVRIAAAAHEWTLAHDADWTAAEVERIYEEAVTERRSG